MAFINTSLHVIADYQEMIKSQNVLNDFTDIFRFFVHFKAMDESVIVLKCY